jgi:hypothetical protein
MRRKRRLTKRMWKMKGSNVKKVGPFVLMSSSNLHCSEAIHHYENTLPLQFGAKVRPHLKRNACEYVVFLPIFRLVQVIFTSTSTSIFTST